MLGICEGLKKTATKKEKNLESRLFVRLNDEQMAVLNERVRETGFSSKSQYLRRLIDQGMVVRIDTRPVREYVYLIRNASNNINQIAKKINESGNVANTDVLVLQNSVTEMFVEARKAADFLINLAMNARADIETVNVKGGSCCSRLKAEVKYLLDNIVSLKSEAERMSIRLQGLL